MVFTSCVLPSNLTNLPHLGLPSGRDYFWCGLWATYFSGHSLSNLHSSVECPGPCNKHVFFTGSIIARRDCNFCPVLYRAAIIGVGGRGGFSSLFFPNMTVTVGICPNIFFRGWFSFVHLFNNFHFLEHGASFPEMVHFEIPSLKVRLILSSVGHRLKKDFI